MNETDQIADYLHQRYGFAKSGDSLVSLRQALATRLRATDSHSLEGYFEVLRSSAPESTALIKEIVIPETFFFRYPESFRAFVRWAGERRSRPLRVLSFACSTGEEAYTIALSLFEAGWKPGEFRIEGRDLTASALAKAKQGVYSANSFRSGEETWKERYFRRHGSDWEVVPLLRDAVHFQQANLFDLHDHKSWDVIFCRNVLIYFSEEQQHSAVARLREALCDDGILFVGPSEPPMLLQQGWGSTAYPMSFSCVKTTREARALAAKAAPPRVVQPKSARIAQTSPRGLVQAKSEEPSLAQAEALADGGRFEEAKALLARIILATPDLAEAHFLMGLVEEATRRNGEAEAAYRRTLFLAPSHGEALRHMSLLLESQGRHAAAEQLTRRARRATSP